jgi:hypothetical protein
MLKYYGYVAFLRIFDWIKARSQCRANRQSAQPPGRHSFDRLQHCLDSQSPLQGHSCFGALNSAEMGYSRHTPGFSNTLQGPSEQIEFIQISLFADQSLINLNLPLVPSQFW